MQTTGTENSTATATTNKYQQRRQYTGWILVGIGAYAIWTQLGTFIMTAVGK